MDNNNQTPRHIAIIMDGNGRWASQRGEQRLYGHLAGVKSVKRIVQSSVKFGVEYLTIYAFSTENWGRPKNEVEGLMELFCKTISEELCELMENGVRLRFMGKLSELSADIRENIAIAEKMTESNTKLTLVVALNYSAKIELCDVIKSVAQDVVDGKLNIDAIDSSVIDSRLYISDIPSPDLLIRTSGEERISNFMLWQIAYSEFYFSEVLWPDFGEEDFKKAIDEYSRRNRRFGLV